MFLLRDFGSGKPHAHTHTSHVLAKLRHIRWSQVWMLYLHYKIYMLLTTIAAYFVLPYLTEVRNGTIGSFSQQNGSYTQEESLECGK
jgi:hypothetical protein